MGGARQAAARREPPQPIGHPILHRHMRPRDGCRRHPKICRRTGSAVRGGTGYSQARRLPDSGGTPKPAILPAPRSWFWWHLPRPHSGPTPPKVGGNGMTNSMLHMQHIIGHGGLRHLAQFSSAALDPAGGEKAKRSGGGCFALMAGRVGRIACSLAPPGRRGLWFICSGGSAALHHRLIARVPPARRGDETQWVCGRPRPQRARRRKVG